MQYVWNFFGTFPTCAYTIKETILGKRSYEKWVLILKLKKIPTPQHAADAIAAALTYFEMNAKKTANTNK